MRLHARALRRVPSEPSPAAPTPAPARRRHRRPLRVLLTGAAAGPLLAVGAWVVPVTPGAVPVAAADGPVAPARAVTATRMGPSQDLLHRERLLRERRAQVRASSLQAERDATSRVRAAAAQAAAARPSTVVPVDAPVGSPFGPRWGRLHAGLDFPAPLGTPVRAVADGVVERAGPASGYGTLVVVDHGDGTLSAYGHMRVVAVAPGRVLRAGDAVGEVGNEGRSTGPHLHFEVRQPGGPVDPRTWLAARGLTV